MTNIEKFFKHFAIITKHKFYVAKFCFKCGYYKRGLLHDLSKYGITEFFSSAKYFQGNKSSIDAEKTEKGYSIAWQHHKGHNPHHWEYWIDNVGTYKNTAIEMPTEYEIEMLCDWLSAGIVYSKQKISESKPYKEPLEYYNSHLSKRIFHPLTQSRVETYLNIVAEKGINEFCKYVRRYVR